MDLHEALMTTRSMRRLSDEPVDDAVIQRILRAAVQAPSGGNIQPYQFLVVTEADVKERLAAVYLRAHQRYRPAVEAAIPPFEDEAAERRHRRNYAAVDHLARNLADVPAMVLVLVPRISMTVTDDEGTMDVGPVYASVWGRRRPPPRRSIPGAEGLCREASTRPPGRWARPPAEARLLWARRRRRCRRG